MTNTKSKTTGTTIKTPSKRTARKTTKAKTSKAKSKAQPNPTPLNPVPKPKTTKPKKAVNGYKGKAERVCHYCGTPGAERHEVYGGPNRQISIDNGFQVDLCQSCHAAWHEQKLKLWKDRKAAWQRGYQYRYEQLRIRAGDDPCHARRKWMELIGRNYLNDDLTE